MEFDNAFDVPLTPSQAWAVLTDIRRVAPCMPGAELTEIVDTRNFKGKIAARLGPVALAFAGNVEFENLDEAKHNARIRAQGNDAKGRGSAYATATFRIEPAGAGSRVLIHTDLMLSGAVAQYGRGVGMIQATAAQIISPTICGCIWRRNRPRSRLPPLSRNGKHHRRWRRRPS